MITKTGKVTIEGDLITIENFEIEGGALQDLAGLAIAWAIEILKNELAATLVERKP